MPGEPFKTLLAIGVSEGTTKDLADIAWGQPVLMAVLHQFADRLRSGEGTPVELLAKALCTEAATHAQMTEGMTKRLLDAEALRPVVVHMGKPG